MDDEELLELVELETREMPGARVPAGLAEGSSRVPQRMLGEEPRGPTYIYTYMNIHMSSRIFLRKRRVDYRVPHCGVRRSSPWQTR